MKYKERINYIDIENWILKNRKEVVYLYTHISIPVLGIKVYPKTSFKLIKGFVTTDASIRSRYNMDISGHFSKEERVDLLKLVTEVAEENRLNERRETIKKIKNKLCESRNEKDTKGTRKS